MTDFSQLTALIIDPNPGMRANLHNMLNLCHLTKVEHAVSAGAAIRQLQGKSYDIIICEYDLGEGQDGQQLLEDLRHNQIISLWAIYFIVTAERAYEKVLGAAELGPTDYILKPFTADMLLERIVRALDKRAIFQPVHQLIAQSRLHEAVTACATGAASQPRHANDFMRLRAEVHMALGEAQQAETIYRQLIEMRTVAWARLGLAKAVYHQERFADAESLLRELVAENNKYMDAYDWLARTHEKIGQLAQAQQVLQDAVAISPHAVRRLRKLGEVALAAGDVGIAERSFQQVVSKARYSTFRDPEDHVKLVKTLVTKGDTQQAATVIRDLQKSLNGNDKMPACRALSSALLHESLGDAVRAAQELEAAVAACREPIGMSAEMKMVLANTCLANNLDQGASEVMLEVMNNAANGAEMARAMSIFERHGRADLAEKTAQESRRQVVELVSSGADKARQGDYKGAVEAMQAAVQKLPDNPQVIFNAAVAILKYLENLGWDRQLGERCRRLIDRARELEPANPRLASLAELHRQIMRKHGLD
ncbi:tetratricopeptide repeat-containing response regulator [Noviherbaspirillum sedimenti]|uniref:Response regulator n=1 Tax=Noviherbaspirillum sedimenti TaxID=2320865 RepID=A0A3A3GJC8_9BURK|nr:tetratricopeptide repeat-containing response regulator [Noviherbaspirillum sedimenti]RJG02406.1 response regulator [Noviherbaspirillum sedimenti]